MIEKKILKITLTPLTVTIKQWNKTYGSCCFFVVPWFGIGYHIQLWNSTKGKLIFRKDRQKIKGCYEDAQRNNLPVPFLGHSWQFVPQAFPAVQQHSFFRTCIISFVTASHMLFLTTAKQSPFRVSKREWSTLSFQQVSQRVKNETSKQADKKQTNKSSE